MNCHVYYRGWHSKALRQIAVSDIGTPNEALTEVALHLKSEKEAHFNPRLVLIVGGKA